MCVSRKPRRTNIFTDCRAEPERLITAHQDGLLNLEQLRERMPNLKQQSQAVSSEIEALEMAKLDDAKYLTLAHNLSGFRQRLRATCADARGEGASILCACW